MIALQGVIALQGKIASGLNAVWVCTTWTKVRGEHSQMPPTLPHEMSSGRQDYGTTVDRYEKRQPMLDDKKIETLIGERSDADCFRRECVSTSERRTGKVMTKLF
jgi:hypothetical protein